MPLARWLRVCWVTSPCAFSGPTTPCLVTISRCQHQNRHVLTRRPQLRRDREPVLAGQHHVEHHDIEVRFLLEQQIERLLAGLRDDHVVSVGLEIEPDSFGDVLLILNDENAAHDVARGSSTVKVAPRPSPSLCANTRPPWARAMVRTM